MSVTEALRTKERLEVENAKLREANPESAAQIDAEADAAQCRAENEQLMREAAQLRALYEQLLRDMQEEQEKLAKKEEEVAERQRRDVATITELRENAQQQEARWQDLDLECGKLRVEVQRAHEITELECYRAVAAERQKWEAREERMIWQLQRLEAAELLRAQVTPGEDSGAVTSLNEECGSHYENRQRSTETSRRVTIQSPTSRDCTAESPGSPTTPSSSGNGSPEPIGQVSKQSPGVNTVEQVNEVRSFPLEASTGVFAGESTEADTGVGRGVSMRVTGGLSTETSTVVSPPPGVPTEPVTGVSLTSAALLAQQLPPLPKFRRVTIQSPTSGD